MAGNEDVRARLRHASAHLEKIDKHHKYGDFLRDVLIEAEDRLRVADNYVAILQTRIAEARSDRDAIVKPMALIVKRALGNDRFKIGPYTRSADELIEDMLIGCPPSHHLIESIIVRIGPAKPPATITPMEHTPDSPPLNVYTGESSDVAIQASVTEPIIILDERSREPTK